MIRPPCGGVGQWKPGEKDEVRFPCCMREGEVRLAQAETRITETGLPYARLDCLVNNPRLRTYYELTDWTVVGEQPTKDGDSGNPYAVALLE